MKCTTSGGERGHLNVPVGGNIRVHIYWTLWIAKPTLQPHTYILSTSEEVQTWDYRPFGFSGLQSPYLEAYTGNLVNAIAIREISNLSDHDICMAEGKDSYQESNNDAATTYLEQVCVNLGKA